MQIRQAETKDAAGIAKVHVDSWRTTYKNILPAEFLENLSYEQRTILWDSNISDQTNYVVVAENAEGTIIGFGTAAKRKTNTVDGAADLTSIYLLEDYQSQGIGKMLLAELFLHFKRLGYKNVFVEVLEENKTRYFYEYYGAKPIKSVEIKMAGTVLKELIYEWDHLDAVLEKLTEK